MCFVWIWEQTAIIVRGSSYAPGQLMIDSDIRTKSVEVKVPVL